MSIEKLAEDAIAMAKTPKLEIAKVNDKPLEVQVSIDPAHKGFGVYFNLDI